MLPNGFTLVLKKGITTLEPMNLVRHIMPLTSLQNTVHCINTSKVQSRLKFLSRRTDKWMQLKGAPISQSRGIKML